MKTKYLKLRTAVLVTLMGVCGLSACKSDKSKMPWNSDDIDEMMVPMYGCPLSPEEMSEMDSLRNELIRMDSLMREKEQLEGQEKEA